MFLIVLSILVAISAKEINPTRLKKLANTPLLNFTFYFEYQYPSPDCTHITLDIIETGQFFEAIFDKYNSTLNAIEDVTKPYQATFINQSALYFNKSIFIEIGEQLQLSKTLIIQVKNESMVAELADDLVELSKHHSFKLAWIERSWSYQIDHEKCHSEAKQLALAKSQTICQKYFGMQLAQMSLFQKVIQQEQVQGNLSSEINETDQFVGNIYEIQDELQSIQDQQDWNELNDFFKCQIQCKNNKKIAIPIKKEKKKIIDKKTQKLVKLNSQSNTKKQSKTKQDKEMRINKKEKKILKSTQL